MNSVRCYLCGSERNELVVDIRSKPARETDFGIPLEAYSRQVYHCIDCSVYFNAQNMLGSEIYGQQYNQATYSHKLFENFARIRKLPEDQSDNKQRIRRIMGFISLTGRKPQSTRILDVGSGLCVFLAELKDHGFQCYAIDPDPLSARHALEHAKVDGAHAGTLDNFSSDQKFDVITFNKVLEHVPDPVRVLKMAIEFLSPGGFIYVELPDGESVLQNANAVDREEFYIQHFTIFTPGAFDILARSSGLRANVIQQIHEPSGKYTLYSFLFR